MDDSLRRRITENVASIRDRIAAACGRAGRPPGSVRLVAVTKYVDAAVTRLIADAGCDDLAESRPQQLWAKAVTLADRAIPVRWHLVGHLQRNKVRRTLPYLGLLQTLDSRRLLDVVEGEAAAASRPCEVLVEVNLAGDPGRSGAMIADVPGLVAAALEAPHLRLRGLMGMAGHPDSPAADPRGDFARLRELRDRLVDVAPVEALAELSMGMTGDFEQAILEGATLVRIGSALVEGTDWPAA
ncbi:MAG: YggS family pyridoxal phosphate-dependent enzyme [Planctomycetaceae bacterium]